MRTESRELTSHDFLGGAIASRVEHIIGTGFMCLPTITAGDESGDIASAVADFSEEVLSQIGVDRKTDLWAILKLAQRSIDVDGEAFIIKSDTPSETPATISLEVISADRVATPIGSANPRIINGIEYSAAGAVRKYHVSVPSANGIDKTRSIDAANVYHVWNQESPRTNRGIPLVSKAAARARDGRDLADASLIAAQMEACFAGFVHSTSSAASKAISASDHSHGASRYQDISPGSLTYLNSDESISFANPTKSNAAGSLLEYTNRLIAAAINWPYELCVGDWRGISFAGGRIVLSSARKTVEASQELLIHQFLKPLHAEIVKQGTIAGIIPSSLSNYQASRCSWIGPEWNYSLNPAEDTKNQIMRIDNNLTTLEEVASLSQRNWKEITTQRAAERDVEREQEIVPNATVMAAANAQSQTEGE